MPKIGNNFFFGYVSTLKKIFFDNLFRCFTVCTCTPELLCTNVINILTTIGINVVYGLMKHIISEIENYNLNMNRNVLKI